jgi:colicin import membrane protein
MATKAERKPAARAKRSKAEVQSEFEDLQEQTAARAVVDAKTEVAAIEHDEESRAEVAEVGVEAVVQRIAGLGLDVSRALSDVAEKRGGGAPARLPACRCRNGAT